MTFNAAGTGGTMPTLQLEDRLPHVQFNRSGSSSSAWFTSSSSLTFPHQASLPGYTFAAVVRMSPVVDSLTRGTSFEPVFMCGASPDDPQNMLLLQRFGSTTEMALSWSNGSTIHAYNTQYGPANGRWETLIFRHAAFGTSPALNLHGRGAFRPIAARDPSNMPALPAPFSLPRSLVSLKGKACA